MKKIVTSAAGLMLAAAVSLAGSLPDYKSLCGAMADLSGWKASECEGMKAVNPMMGEIVTAERSYERDGKRLDVSVLSGMQAAMMWAPYSAGTMMESDKALVRIEKIEGFTVGISYDKEEKSGGIVVQIAPNAVLVANFEKMGWKEALKMVEKLDWKRLKREFEGR
ncbi:hypothetical protein [Hydrogenimonas sp.]